MGALLVCRRALAAVGIAVVAIVVTSAPAGAVEPPPVDASEITAPSVPSSPPLRTVASERARQFAFPFALALLVIAFLTAQRWVGTSDPRLAAAPVDDDARGFR